ncbi:MAG: FGGY family carbohydrate kinase [Solidesulfovibrio sp.]
MQQVTGLVIDAYFSGSKLRWMLDNVPDARERAEHGELAFGTVDTWLLWNLTGGARPRHRCLQRQPHHAINDVPGEWDDELLDLLRIPREVLPEVRPSSAIWARRPPPCSATPPDRRHRGRPAGGALRAELLRSQAWPRTRTAPGASC